MKILKWLKDLVEKYMVIFFVLCSVVFAFIIHCLFSSAAPNEWFAAKWNAGDILTFVSTVTLGLLAVWQNKKFKDENDASQSRMENLAKKANEISIVNKLLEREGERISRLREINQSFIDACKTEAISMDVSDVAQYPDDYKKLYVKIKMDNRIKEVKLCTITLLSELEIYQNDTDVDNLISLISCYSKCSIEFINKFKVGSQVEDIFARKNENEKKYINCISKFILYRENLLNRVIFEDLTLDQIKTIYRKGNQ